MLLRRMVLAVDPEAAARWYRKGVRELELTLVLRDLALFRACAHAIAQPTRGWTAS